METAEFNDIRQAVIDEADTLAALIAGLHRGERLLVGKSRKHGFKVSRQILKPIDTRQIRGDARDE